jgi:hypothetical protein
MSVVATRIFTQGRQWCVGEEYVTQVTADHPTRKALGASAKQEASKGQFPPFLTVNNSFVPTTMCYATRKRQNMFSVRPHFRQLTTWSRDLREKILVLGQQASMACPRMRTEERPPMAANILNNQSRTSEKVWSSSLSVGWGANNSSP